MSLLPFSNEFEYKFLHFPFTLPLSSRNSRTRDIQSHIRYFVLTQFIAPDVMQQRTRVHDDGGIRHTDVDFMFLISRRLTETQLRGREFEDARNG